MLKLHRVVSMASLVGLMACQAVGPSGGEPRLGSGGATGSGGAGMDGGAIAGHGANTGGTGAAGSGGAGVATGGAGVASGGAGGTTGGGGAAEGGIDAATDGASAATGGAGRGGADAGAGGTGTASGGRGEGGRGGTSGATVTGGRGGASSGGGGGGGGGQMESCPFTSTERFVWPGAAPGGAGVTVVETITERSTNPQIRDRQIAGVTKPSVLPYLAAKPNGAAVIVIPGGGYRYLAYDKEGTEIATWLNSIGVTAFVLKYRLPLDFPNTSTWVALADAQRAIRLIRKSAAACKIDPARIGVIGFSAGGHLASQLETRFSARVTPATDDIDAIDARPAFGVLMYPVISMDAAIAHAGSRMMLLGANPTPAAVILHSSELQVFSATPATFTATSLRDPTVNPENSRRFDAAVAAAGVAHELHLYQDGTHGTGIRGATGDMAAWPMQCATWLTSSKFLSGPVP